jgi:hypothetical protein
MLPLYVHFLRVIFISGAKNVQCRWDKALAVTCRHRPCTTCSPQSRRREATQGVARKLRPANRKGNWAFSPSLGSSTWVNNVDVSTVTLLWFFLWRMTLVGLALGAGLGAAYGLGVVPSTFLLTGVLGSEDPGTRAAGSPSKPPPNVCRREFSVLATSCVVRPRVISRS